jgi:hypothetical protein
MIRALVESTRQGAYEHRGMISDVIKGKGGVRCPHILPDCALKSVGPHHRLGT